MISEWKFFPSVAKSRRTFLLFLLIHFFPILPFPLYYSSQTHLSAFTSPLLAFCISFISVRPFPFPFALPRNICYTTYFLFRVLLQLRTTLLFWLTAGSKETYRYIMFHCFYNYYNNRFINVHFPRLKLSHSFYHFRIDHFLTRPDEIKRSHT